MMRVAVGVVVPDRRRGLLALMLGLAVLAPLAAMATVKNVQQQQQQQQLRVKPQPSPSSGLPVPDLLESPDAKYDPKPKDIDAAALRLRLKGNQKSFSYTISISSSWRPVATRFSAHSSVTGWKRGKIEKSEQARDLTDARSITLKCRRLTWTSQQRSTRTDLTVSLVDLFSTFENKKGKEEKKKTFPSLDINPDKMDWVVNRWAIRFFLSLHILCLSRQYDPSGDWTKLGRPPW